MLKIWGRANSTNVKKVMWAAEELGLPYTRVDAGGAFGVVNDPDYRALNPNGLVPLIEDNGVVLWESNTIVRYLVAQYGAGSLQLEGAARQAHAEKWMDWATSSLAVPFRAVFWNIVRLPPAERDPASFEAGLAACSKLLAIVNAELARQPYLSGQRFGIGDIPIGCFAYAWFGMAIERPDLPHLKRWYEGLAERPAYRSAVMTPLT